MTTSKKEEANIPAVYSWEGFKTTGLNQRCSTHKHAVQGKEHILWLTILHLAEDVSVIPTLLQTRVQNPNTT